ncbi:MAG: urease accessory UreF family protein, partial [Pseudomonadota bacterium]
MVSPSTTINGVATGFMAEQKALLRLLQLCSPALPVGAYAFSQGLEAAMDLKWLRNLQQIETWLSLQLQHSVARVELPLLLRLHRSWHNDDYIAIQHWNDLLLACRESEELRLSDTAMGNALARLLPTLSLPLPCTIESPSFIALFAFAAQRWQLSAELAALGLVWSWLENQVIAATKLLPLGQTQAQQLLSSLQQQVPTLIQYAQQ